jgi:transcriptional regulator with XRE-family HTH domain
MTNTSVIGKNIKFLRENLGLTQENIANYLSINRAEVSYFENGDRNPSLDILNKLADLYGVELKNLLSEDNSFLQIEAKLAFRSAELSDNDLKTISYFRKIIKNYTKMLMLENRND